MKLVTFGIITLFSVQLLVSQEIKGSLLLEKAIQYHDTNHQWKTFKGEFDIEMEMPNSPKRISQITINLPKEYFKVKVIDFEFRVRDQQRICIMEYLTLTALLYIVEEMRK